MTNVKVKVFETDEKRRKAEESPYLCMNRLSVFRKLFSDFFIQTDNR